MAVGNVRTIDFLVNTSFAANTSGAIGNDDTQDAAETSGSLVVSGAGVKTANYTAALTDRGCVVPFNTTSGTTSTTATYFIPTDASVALPTGALLGLLWLSTGTIQPTFTATTPGTTTLWSPTGASTARVPGSIIWAWKYTTNFWYLFGDLT